jgi:PhoH-like ATPase
VDVHPTRHVILVSKDTNIRMKAKAFGMTAQDYTRDKVESIDKLYTGKSRVEIPVEELDRIYENGHLIPAEEVPSLGQKIANENLIVRSGAKSVLACYDSTGNQIGHTCREGGDREDAVSTRCRTPMS